MWIFQGGQHKQGNFKPKVVQEDRWWTQNSIKLSISSNAVLKSCCSCIPAQIWMLWSNGWGMHSFRCTVGKCMLRKSSIFCMSTVSYLPILVQSFSIIMITLMVVTRTLIKLIACGTHWEWTISTTSTWFTQFFSTKTHWTSKNPNNSHRIHVWYIQPPFGWNVW